MMDDDEDLDDVMVVEPAAASAPAVVFSSSDTTTCIPFPKRHVFVVPRGADGIQLWSLRHPRHGECCLFLTARAPTSTDDGPVLCEVQERRHAFGDTWFLGDHVEPSSALSIATPVDPTFFAIALARLGGPLAEKLVSQEDILTQRDASFAQLPAGVRALVGACLNNVCEVKSFGPDETYFRFCMRTFCLWIQVKHAALVGSEALPRLLQLEKPLDSQEWTAEQGEVLREKAFALLAEYLHSGVIEAAAEACGVHLHKEKQPQPPVALRASTADKATDEPASKKPKVELKSASVKRLEKAGPPKGTPTLMSMFAKKQAKSGAGSTP